MGFNTVAVILNDHTHRIAEDGPIGAALARAIRHYDVRHRDHLAADFGAGRIVSMAHADYSQVVIVGRNSGTTAAEATNLDVWALEQMQRCLERHGYRVTKRRKPLPPSPVSEKEPTP